MKATEWKAYFSTCSDVELLQAAEAINRTKYPDNWLSLSLELKKRSLIDPLDKEAQVLLRETAPVHAEPPKWDGSSFTKCPRCNHELIPVKGNAAAGRRCGSCKIQWLSRAF